jgi:hypothetical protein
MNQIHPTSPITINDKQLSLRYEHGDFAKAERRAGEALLGPPAVKFWNCNLPAYQTAVLLLTGLIHIERKASVALGVPFPMQLDDVFDLITYENTAYISQTVTAAVEEAFERMTPKSEATPDPEPEAEQASPLAQPSTGTESGASL